MEVEVAEAAGKTRLSARTLNSLTSRYDDLVAAGSIVAAAGRARIEGKDHFMADGDVLAFGYGKA